jgi:hypothetical protein
MYKQLMIMAAPFYEAQLVISDKRTIQAIIQQQKKEKKKEKKK